MLQKPAAEPALPDRYVSSGTTPLNLALTGNGRKGFQAGTYTLVVGDSNSGKAQPLRAKILTPNGWKLMGDIRKGDVITDPRGGTQKVLAVHPQGKKQTYRVTFSDGGSTTCCGDHLWSVETNNTIKREQSPLLMSIDQIRASGLYYKTKFPKMKYSVPVVKAVEWSKQHTGRHLPIAPYVLGTLLGNGCFSSENTVLLSSNESEVVARAESQLPDGHYLSELSPGNYRVNANRNRERSAKNKIAGSIVDLGLCGQRANSKFIPEIYLRSSVPNRTELLKGLMDTDGFADKNGGLSYSTVSKELANGVRDLCGSLGILTTVGIRENPQYTYKGEKRVGQRCYNIQIRPPKGFEVFHLPRKLERNKQRSRESLRSITEITPLRFQECQCISVSAPHGLYVTDDYIVTHNTYITLNVLAEAAINPEFDDYRLIYNGPENGAIMDIRKCFGPLADRLEMRVPGNGAPETIEEFYDQLTDDLNGKQPVIEILDSFDALPSLEEEAKVEDDRKSREQGKKAGGSYGTSKARSNSARIRVITNKLGQTGSMFFGISQTRDNIGHAAMFNPKTRSGGKALKFFATSEVWLTNIGKILVPFKGNKVQKGMTSLIKVKRTRHTGQEWDIKVPILLDVGVDDIGACVKFLVDWKHWEGTKDGGKVKAPEFDHNGTVDSLCIKIANSPTTYKQLRILVSKHWRMIQEKTAVSRPNKYANQGKE